MHVFLRFFFWFLSFIRHTIVHKLSLLVQVMIKSLKKKGHLPGFLGRVLWSHGTFPQMEGEREHRKDEWKGKGENVFLFPTLVSPILKILTPVYIFTGWCRLYVLTAVSQPQQLTLEPWSLLSFACFLFLPTSSCLLLWTYCLINKPVALEKQSFLSMLELWMHFPITTLLYMLLDTVIIMRYHGWFMDSSEYFITIYNFWKWK